jgi:hypothetical protein
MVPVFTLCANGNVVGHAIVVDEGCKSAKPFADRRRILLPANVYESLPYLAREFLQPEVPII